MTTWTSPPRSGQYRPERCLLRHKRRATASRVLAGYVDAVAAAVRTKGFTVLNISVSAGQDLEARITVCGAPDHVATGQHSGGQDNGQNSGQNVKLAWAEDTGWSVVADHLGGTSASPWRYLHLQLAPSPETVAEFLTAVLDNSDEVGMLYPARFRFRNQPLQPVLDDLARHTPTTPSPHTH
jgi:hypothetical protein